MELEVMRFLRLSRTLRTHRSRASRLRLLKWMSSSMADSSMFSRISFLRLAMAVALEEMGRDLRLPALEVV